MSLSNRKSIEEIFVNLSTKQFERIERCPGCFSPARREIAFARTVCVQSDYRAHPGRHDGYRGNGNDTDGITEQLGHARPMVASRSAPSRKADDRVVAKSGSKRPPALRLWDGS